MKSLVEIIVPCYNEEIILEQNIRILSDFLEENLNQYRYKIIIVNNGSADSTDLISKKLSERIDKVEYIYIQEKGRGNALHYVWSNSKADIVGYVDADLSIDIKTLPILIDAVHNKQCDIAIASRMQKNSKVIGRSIKRTIISICYSYFYRIIFFVSFKDAQCGMKIIGKNIVINIVPHIKDKYWFFDTELLILSDKCGYSIKEFPTTMIESERKSTVSIINTSWDNIKCIARLKFKLH